MLLMTEEANLSLLRLLQLSSASLPIGAYAFSQAMESAVHSGWTNDSDDARQWLSLQMTHSIASADAPILLRLMRSLDRGDLETFVYWNAYSLACRESKELRLADMEMGAAMKRLLENVDLSFPCIDRKEICFCAGFAVAAVQWKILPRMALTGLFWSWLENSIAAAVKLVPLGQNAAQRLIGELLPIIQPAIDKAELMDDRFVGSGLPAIGMASAWHESQHTRLFRS